MKSNPNPYRSYKFKPTIISQPKQNLTSSQQKLASPEQKITKLREKYKPKIPDKKPICPHVLVRRIRPDNIKINNFLIEQQAFGLKPFDKDEMEELFYLKGWKKQDSQKFYIRISQGETGKLLHDLNYLELFKGKTRVMDLVHERILNQKYRNMR